MRWAWRDAQGIFDGRDLATLTLRAFNLSPRNAAWRQWRAEVKAAQEGPTGAFELAQHPEALDWRVNP